MREWWRSPSTVEEGWGLVGGGGLGSTAVMSSISMASASKGQAWSGMMSADRLMTLPHTCRLARKHRSANTLIDTHHQRQQQDA